MYIYILCMYFIVYFLFVYYIIYVNFSLLNCLFSTILFHAWCVLHNFYKWSVNQNIIYSNTYLLCTNVWYSIFTSELIFNCNDIWTAAAYISKPCLLYTSPVKLFVAFILMFTSTIFKFILCHTTTPSCKASHCILFKSLCFVYQFSCNPLA